MRSPTRFSRQISASSNSRTWGSHPQNARASRVAETTFFNGDMGERLKPPDCESGDPGELVEGETGVRGFESLYLRQKIFKDRTCSGGKGIPPPLYCKGFRTIFLGLFQYGDLHFGHTLGSPLVLLRGIHSWGQRVHLYPFALIVTIAIQTNNIPERNIASRAIFTSNFLDKYIPN